MEFVKLFFMIITNSIAITIMLKKKIELTIPISVITMTLIVYISGLFNHLEVGTKIVELVSIIATVFNMIYIIKAIIDKKVKRMTSKIVTPRFSGVHLAFFRICCY